MQSTEVSGNNIPKWEEQFDRFPNLPKEKHMYDEIVALRKEVVIASESSAQLHPNLSLLARYSLSGTVAPVNIQHQGEFVRLADVSALLGRKRFVKAAQPEVLLDLPAHETRRVVIVSDDMVEGKRKIGIAIKPPIGG